MEQFTFCKMGVSMIRKFSLAISLMIRLNLLKYSYIIRPEVQRFFSPFVVRQNFNGNVSSNHIKPVHPFTFNIYKIVLTTKYSHSLLSSSKIQRTQQRNYHKKQSASRMSKECYNCFKDEKTLSGKGCKHERGDILKCIFSSIR